MMKILIAALMLTAMLSSCSKKVKKCPAGTGGMVTLVAFGKHHGKIARPYSVHIKFGSTEFPGSDASNYDLSIVADTTEDHIEIENLKCGDYYIYMKGYDTAVRADVIGGIPYTIAESTSGTIDINVPITE